MKNQTVLQSLLSEATKNMCRFMKSGDNEKALMWAEQVEKYENELMTIEWK
jgi:hypothetical protein